MKLKLLRLLGVFYLFFFVMEVLRELLLSSKKLDQFIDHPIDSALQLFIASLLFFAYTLAAYSFLYHGYPKQSKLFTILGIIVCAISVIGLRYVVEEVLIKAITGYGNYNEGTTAIYYILDNLYYAILYTIFGVSWFFINYSIHKEQRQQQLELENKKTELSFLRAQVNPHFLFNMLNNIYSLINMGSDKALMATDKLSKLLRYSLYESEKMVTVTQEIQAVRDYLSLQELRFRESVHLNISVHPETIHKEIAPFLLMPLVENAFKHGLVTDENHPVEITITPFKNGLRMKIKNAIAQRKKDTVGGIGVENLKKRLQLIYGERHEFETHIKNNSYTTTLTITNA
jgi:LytS/YehU family sensor histidine kinase